jgi:tetratricopeptide (TPR) repeat protein
MGDLGAAEAGLHEARAIWRELGNAPMLCENLVSSATLSRYVGRDDESLSLAGEALGLAEESGNLWGRSYALMHMSEVRLSHGELGSALAAMRESIELSERAGFLAPQATTRATLASTYAYLGDHARARELLRLAKEIATERLPSASPTVFGAQAMISLLTGELDEAGAALDAGDANLLPDPSASIQLPLLRGRVALARGEHARSREIADEVVARLHRMGIREFEAEAELLSGRALAAAGDPAGAESALRRARSLAEELGHDRILWEVAAELGGLVGGDESAELLATARRLVERIATTIEEEALRASFLARPDVGALLG